MNSSRNFQSRGSRMRTECPIISSNYEVQIFYESMRDNGVSHTLAEMLALRKSANFVSDATFMRGHFNGNQFEKFNRSGEFYRKKANAAGVSTVGKRYLSGLAAYPGDPRAWVSTRDEIKKLMKERNWTCDGTVKHAGNEDLLAEQIAVRKRPDGVAEDILVEKVEFECEKNPELAPTTKEKVELKEQLRERMRPKKF